MEDIRDIISDTVNETVAKMKMAGLTKDNRKTAIEKLEELLRNYPTFKAVEGKALSPPSELQEIPVAIREQSGVLCFHSR